MGHKSVRIDDEKEKEIMRIAQKEDRSFAYVVNKAIDEYLKRERRKK